MADTMIRTQKQEAEPQAALQQPRKPFDWSKLFIYSVLSVGAVISIIPFLWMVSWSLMTASEIASGGIYPTQLHFENYLVAWDEANFALFMWNSARVAVISIGGMLAFCIPAAYAFARMRFVGRDALFGGMLATLMIPNIVTLIPNFLTVTWLSRLSESVCGDPCQWLNNWPSLTIPFMASAFSIFLLRQFFTQIPEDLWDAARIDGAGHLLFLVRVVVPLSKAAIMTVVTLAFVASWNSLLWPLLVVQTDEWRPVAFGLTKFVSADAPGAFHLQMAASVIMIVPILILYFFTQKQFTEGIASSGLKG
ncbi:MAG: carbohydrate ABC transporter permease [Anaerolineae bacterium]|nr:carbohydrate ABC transporter permease [Anaerolineae bacterium]